MFLYTIAQGYFKVQVISSKRAIHMVGWMEERSTLLYSRTFIKYFQIKGVYSNHVIILPHGKMVDEFSLSQTSQQEIKKVPVDPKRFGWDWILLNYVHSHEQGKRFPSKKILCKMFFWNMRPWCFRRTASCNP